MYNPYSTNMYNPYNTFNMPQNNLTNSFITQGQQVLKVHGKDGANALNLTPNSSALALDETAPIVWYVQSDSAGYKTTIPYDITPHISSEVKLQNNLEQRLEKLEGIIYGKSDIKSNATEQSNTNNTTDNKSSKTNNG